MSSLSVSSWRASFGLNMGLLSFSPFPRGLGPQMRMMRPRRGSQAIRLWGWGKESLTIEENPILLKVV